MAEPTAGPSNIPVITISTHNQSSPEEDSASSSCASPTLTALETPTSLEPEPQALEPSQTSEIPAEESGQEQEKTHIVPSLSPGGSTSEHGTMPPRTESGAPVSLKRSKTPSKGKKSVQNAQSVENAPWHGVVVDYAPQKEQAWAFQRATGYSDYIGSGFVFINVNGEKKRKNVKDNTYVFIVLEGAVEVLIHQTSYAVSTGGVFVVPRGLTHVSFRPKISKLMLVLCIFPLGNFYTIRNISEKEAKLFFTQTRKPDSATVDTGSVNRPSSKSFILADWLLQHIAAYILRLRVKTFEWYWKNLARYRHHFTTRRLYFLFFALGLMVRRLPFIGSPPILNIQLIRFR
ncbi:hypothetical protein H0H87_004309 [Tephrocybe sp. NHM501043]|nr:hypothetical protein H0H87_004309 [Tephrocybe sp. NHM501043]